jgi:ribonucleoside-triphosphate reductase (thioredoxin)
MGTAITETKHLFAALNNCAFVSTDDIASDPSRPFVFLMDAAMLGYPSFSRAHSRRVGVGFDTNGAAKLIVAGPDRSSSPTFEIPDSREGPPSPQEPTAQVGLSLSGSSWTRTSAAAPSPCLSTD